MVRPETVGPYCVNTIWQSTRSVLILRTSSSRRNSSVSIVTRLRAGWQRNRGSSSGGSKYVSHLQWPDLLWAHPMSDGYCGRGAVCPGLNKRGCESVLPPPKSSLLEQLHLLDTSCRFLWTAIKSVWWWKTAYVARISSWNFAGWILIRTRCGNHRILLPSLMEETYHCGFIAMEVWNKQRNKQSCEILTPLKTKKNLNYISNSSPYRAVNTLRLGYKIQGNNRCFFFLRSVQNT